MIKIAPSILAADFTRLGEAVAGVSNADWLHLDVMDGHFVPNISFGPGVIASLRDSCNLLFDVHLMIDEPIRYLRDYAKAGADRITVHVEACRHLHSTLVGIAELGKKAGVALNPATPLESVRHVLHLVDLVLVMTVNPGFGGQKFIDEMLDKVSEVRRIACEAGRTDLEIEVDGGIYEETIGPAARAGATVAVAGTSVFAADDPAAAVERLRRAAEAGVIRG